MERLGRDDILALEPEVGPDYTVGMFTPDQGMSINPYRQVTAIASDFARRGGRIVRDRVVAIEVEADRVRAVRGENASYACDHAVVCAGAWSTQLLADLGYAIPLESQRGYHVTIAVARDRGDADRSSRRTERYFSRRWRSGLSVAGTVEFGGLARRSQPQARGVSGARPVARVSARANSGRLVVLDGTPSVPSGFAAGHGAKPPSRPVAQFWSRASRADDVGDQRGYSGACDLRRAVEYRPCAVFIRAICRSLKLVRAGDAGLLHDLAPAGDLGADERRSSRATDCRSGIMPILAELLLDVGHAMTALSSSCSLFTMSLGVPAGASMIDQLTHRSPERRPRSAESREPPPAARPRTRRAPASFPSLISGSEGAAAANISETRPATISTTAGAVPL